MVDIIANIPPCFMGKPCLSFPPVILKSYRKGRLVNHPTSFGVREGRKDRLCSISRQVSSMKFLPVAMDSHATPCF
jgi:hypothetical protein